MRRDAPYWRPFPHANEGVRTHALMAIYAGNMAEAAAHDPGVLGTTRFGRDGVHASFHMVNELAEALDDDLAWMAGRLGREGEVDGGRVEASGRTRPSVVLSAHVTTRGNLSITVAPGPLGPDGKPEWHGGDWKRFVNGERWAFQSPRDQVALLRDVEILFGEPDANVRGRSTDFALETRLNAVSFLSGMVLATWEHCKRALSAHYDVHEGFAPALTAGNGRPGRGDHRGLRLAPPVGHPEWHAERQAERQAAKAEEEARPRREAEALLQGYDGDARALIRRWRGSPRHERAASLLSADLGAGDVRVGAAGAWAMLARMDAALHLVEPGWDEGPAPKTAGSVAWEEDPPLGPAVDVAPDAEAEPFALAASRILGKPITRRAPAKPTVAPSARTARLTPAMVSMRPPATPEPPADVDAEPFSLGVARSRFRVPAHYPVPAAPTRDEASDARFYARLPRYAATAEELADLSATSVDELVGRINDGLHAAGRARIPQGEFPSDEKRFRRMLRLHADLVDAPCPAGPAGP